MYNSNGNEEVTYYNVSSFPFPPKVNWATHPYGKDSTDQTNDGKTNEMSYAPPRPPKKSSSKPTTPTTISAQQIKPSCSPKSPGDVGHSVGVYENLEDNHNPETSSTSSSLHSPPGSAGPPGGLYCNIPDTTIENKTAGASQQQISQPSSSPNPSITSGNSPSAIPPKIDRNLKPEVKKANEINAALRNHSTPSTSSQSRTGCMTLPNKSSQQKFGGSYFPGPEIDRSRKPSDGHLTLSSTPAQIKSQQLAMQNNSKASASVRRDTSTLPNPNSSRRRAGPLISPHDKKSPTFHEYETAQELVYMQIDCKTIKDSEVRSQTLTRLGDKKVGGIPSAEGSVEYRLIDHVKTAALNKMMEERKKQLSTSTTKH